ncbi:MAG: hypothetical protein FWC54_04790 [Actinomycetia bacterium]|nr:hypothetical protein [Actinomycetes bacterium]
MYPDEIGFTPIEDHNATAPAPEGAPVSPPAPEAPAASAPQYGPPMPDAAPAPQYAPPPAPQYAPPPQYGPAPAPVYGSANTGTPNNPLGDAKGISIAGMALGIASIPLMSIFFGIIGLFLSIQGQKKTPAGVENSYAKVGKICSIIGIIVGALAICAYIAFIVIGVSRGISSSGSSLTY